MEKLTITLRRQSAARGELHGKTHVAAIEVTDVSKTGSGVAMTFHAALDDGETVIGADFHLARRDVHNASSRDEGTSVYLLEAAAALHALAVKLGLKHDDGLPCRHSRHDKMHTGACSVCAILNAVEPDGRDEEPFR